jgi:hypothetical protein
MLIREGLLKLEEPTPPAGAFGALSKFLEEKKVSLFKGSSQK